MFNLGGLNDLFRNKNVNELYFQGNKVLEGWFNGERVFGKTKTIIIEYERDLQENDLTGPDDSRRKKTLYFIDKKDLEAKRVIKVSWLYLKKPFFLDESILLEDLVGATSIAGHPIRVFDFRNFDLLQVNSADVKKGEMRVIEPYYDMALGSDESSHMKSVPTYKVEIKIEYI